MQKNTGNLQESDTGPENPFPIYLNKRVIKGYGRGTKELQIPTGIIQRNINNKIKTIGANISEENIPELFSCIESGIYYGWGRVAIEDEEDNNVYAM
ncbi:unnamed protein product, partial [Pneumocystis jirovecii]